MWEGKVFMPSNHGPITPERQRHFEAARSALEQMCPGRERRRSDWNNAEWVEAAPHEIERVRWLLVAMGRARGTEGGAAVARLAERGHAVASQPRLGLHPSDPVVPLDGRGVIHLGLMLPDRHRSWKSTEKIARATPLEALPPLRWCTAHESLEVCAALTAEGHDLGQAAFRTDHR